MIARSAASSRAPGEESAGGAALTRAPASVLVVDDVDANFIAVEAVLEPLVCRVVHARSGNEAIELLLANDFAVVLMDVMMPGLHGLDAAGLIAKRPALRAVPIIFLTARESEPADIARAYARGAVDYLIKPVDPAILRSKVAVFVELFSQRQELECQRELACRREREALENRRLYESERGARAHAEAIARAREDILAVVSHDLRNPMSAIGTHTALLRRKLETATVVSAASSIEAIERTVSRMERLVSDLLDTARIQSGGLPLRLQVENVAPMIGEIAEQLRPVLATRKQSLEIGGSHVELRTKCDRERVFQVFSNLVGNASKFSPEGSSIRIEAVPSGSEILFTVSDSGDGISPEHLPHLFEPYWQASRQRKRGLGLGLAIVKGIVEGHGARIWVESQPGLGTCFYFTLPALK